VAQLPEGERSRTSGLVSSLAVELPGVHDAGLALQPNSDLTQTMGLFGRERELRSALDWLDRDGTRALVLAGEAGIGKTAIWREAVRQARGRGWEVLTATPSGSEVQLGLVGLADLLGPLGERSLIALPAPQRRALEVALLHSDDPAVDVRAIGSALLAVLRRLADERPLLLGIDDLQWLDAASAEALAFALRRLSGVSVAVLATYRSSGDGSVPLDLERALGAERTVRLDVASLTLAAVHDMLASRLAFDAPRATMVALFDAADGNPFVALELARELVRRGAALAPGMPLPVPASVRELVAARIGRLPLDVRELLLAAAGLARPTLRLLERLQPDAATCLARAVEEGVLELGPGGRITFSHPLLARVPYERLEPAGRRRLHARLAKVVDRAEERARHRALAASRPSAAVAVELDRAAASAGARGLPGGAAELCMLAARLTPASGVGESRARLLAAAEWHERAGEIDQAVALAQELLAAGDTDGGARARALSLLGVVRSDGEGVVAAVELYGRARRERGAPAPVRAEIHRRLAQLNLRGGDARAADRHARAALRLAHGADPLIEAGAAALAALVAVARGRPLDRALLVRARALQAGVSELSPGYWQETGPEVIEAVALLWAGELEQARAPLERALALATERDEPGPVMHALAYMSSLAIGLGDTERSLDFARRYVELADESEQLPQRAAALWALAVPTAWLGREAHARAAATEGLELAQESGHALYAIGCLGTLGLLELSLARPLQAEGAFSRARTLAEGSGIRALGRVPLLPDSIEALIGVGNLDHARELADELDRRAALLGSPWALALARRCEGLLARARGDGDAALGAFERALVEHGRQDRPLERARTELELGAALRRAQQKRAAREPLERSARTFEAAGADLWAQRARRELGRIGGRTAAAEGELSATEASIAELARAGRTNQEVALALHLSPRTVEWNLSKIYRKLGVRSRTELAAKLERGPAGEGR
jgi:DNA-binding CsgD family transcriptional regulator